MLLFVFCMAMIQTQQDSYFLILKQGKRLEVQEQPKVEGKMLVFHLLNGEPSMLPSNVVDQAATTAYNKDIQDKRAAEVAAKLAADEAARKLAEEAEEKEPIAITDSLEIPIYDRDDGVTISDAAGTDPNQAVLDDTMIGQPRITQRQSSDPFYISKESITRRTTGWQVDCEVSINHTAGARNMSVQLLAVFKGGEELNFVGPVQPAIINRGDKGTVSFVIGSTSELLQTEYTITGDMGGGSTP